LSEDERDLADLTLDLRGLQCPLPILRARNAPGAALEVFATDPLSPVDFAAYCEASGDRLVESVESEGVFRFLIRRGARLPPPPR
jgi:tRNA 2-thiouridine synthesizing protein A